MKVESSIHAWTEYQAVLLPKDLHFGELGEICVGYSPAYRDLIGVKCETNGPDG